MLARGAILPLFLAFAVLACPATASAAVQVTLYGESLCPYCRAWILEQASDLFDQGFSSYIEFRYVAWGNAHQSQVSKGGGDSGTWACLIPRAVPLVLARRPRPWMEALLIYM